MYVDERVGFGFATSWEPTDTTAFENLDDERAFRKRTDDTQQV